MADPQLNGETLWPTITITLEPTAGGTVIPKVEARHMPMLDQSVWLCVMDALNSAQHIAFRAYREERKKQENLVQIARDLPKG